MAFVADMSGVWRRAGTRVMVKNPTKPGEHEDVDLDELEPEACECVP